MTTPEAPVFPVGAAPDFEPFFERLRRDIQLRRAVQRVAFTTTFTPDANRGEIHLIDALTGNITIANPTNARDGMRLYFQFLQDGVGSRTVTWGADFKQNWTIRAGINIYSTISFLYDVEVKLWIQEGLE